MGHFGVSFLEVLVLFEQWAGHWLLSEKVTRPQVRANRPISISSVPVSEGIDIRHCCQFISSLVRALGKIPGGIGRFLPCQVGTHMSRIRHLGWGVCSHGLKCRPLESCHHQCFKAVCGFLGIHRVQRRSFWMERFLPGSCLTLVEGLVNGKQLLQTVSWTVGETFLNGSG